MRTFFTQTLPKDTLKLSNKFQKYSPQFLDNFYLTAGTALSLILGHREVEPMYSSLEKIVEVMGNWFTPEDVGYLPAIT